MPGDDYEPMEFATNMAYELEDPTNPGVDPALGRVRWIGGVLRAPTPTEDHKHKQFMPLGTGPDPAIIAQMGKEHEFEVESTLTEAFQGSDDFLSLSVGNINPTTGVVTPATPLRRFISEGGWTDPVVQIYEAVVVSATPTLGAVYTLTLNGSDFDYTVQVADTAADVQDGIVAALGSPVGITVSEPDSTTIRLTANVAGAPFDASSSEDDAAGTFLGDDTQGGRSWYTTHVSCKVQSQALAVRPNEPVMLRSRIIGTVASHARVAVVCVGDDLTDLVPNTSQPALYSHCQVILRDVPGGIILSDRIDLIEELDIQWTRNLVRRWALTQQYEAARLIEGPRRFTWTMKTTKNQNIMMDIQRNRPEDDNGRLDFQFIIDQPGGFFMDLRLPICNLSDPTRDRGEDIPDIQESFAGVAVGAPTLDLNKAA